MTIENKAVAESGDIRGAMREFLGVFETFKDANDERLAALEAKGGEDVVLTEKIERLNAALDSQKAAIDRLALKAARPERAVSSPAADEKKAAFARYMRAGDPSALFALEGKAVTLGGDPDNGYLAPHETERLISAAVKDVSPIRSIASVREIGTNVFKKPVSHGDGVSGWVAEAGAREQTTAPTLSAVEFATMELFAMPAASQTLLDDTVVDVEQWLAGEVQAEFAAQEGAAFVAGDGDGKPRGFLDYDIVEEGTQEFGEIGYIGTGVNGAFPASNPADKLLDLIYAPKQVYRANGVFVMNRSVLGTIRKFKDGEGNYLWRPSMTPGEPASLLGYSVIESEDMPGLDTGSHSVAFGDFRRGYLIVDRQGVRVLRDPYSAKPYVLFYTTKRVGGGVQDFDAIKILKFAAAE